MKCQHRGRELTTEYGYAVNYDEWRMGLCETCCKTLEQEALSKFKLPSWRDAFAIVILVAIIGALFILLGAHADWV